MLRQELSFHFNNLLYFLLLQTKYRSDGELEREKRILEWVTVANGVNVLFFAVSVCLFIISIIALVFTFGRRYH